MVFIYFMIGCLRILYSGFWREREREQPTKGYTKVIRDMYEGVVTTIRSPGDTSAFPIILSLHQGIWMN